MARVRHQVPGSITVSRQVRIADAFSNGATTKFALEQPANSIIESVLIRAVGDITVGSAVDIDFNLGTNSDHTGNEVVTSIAYLDGSANTTVNAGVVKTCSIVDGVNSDAINSYGNPAAVTTDDRTLFGRFVTGAADVTTGAGKNEVEVHVTFRQF
tara:strand:+ start:85 stop:552 length:468 start_codon:yes stop_codon:yes gene_type:complete